MKIRYLSDIHLDVNQYEMFEPNFGEDEFVVIAGDICGNVHDTIDWVKRNVKCGVFIEGNHIGYNTDKPIEDIQELLRKEFPIDAPVSFLENNHKEVDGVIFVGATLWTNYEYFVREGMGDALKEHYLASARRNASQYMNDFRYNRTRIGTLTTTDCLNWHKASLEYIRKVCEENPDKKIVVVTHHAPSHKSVSGRYLYSDITPAYVSNLDDFILEHPNIVRWIHGHVHSPFAYKIGNCRVLCNPRGYCFRHENERFSAKKWTKV